MAAKSYIQSLQVIKMIAIMLFLFVYTSCIKDDINDCENITDETQLIIKVIDPITKEDITNDNGVNIACVYIFEPNGRFVEQIPVSADSIKQGLPITVKTSTITNNHISVWGNLQQGQVVSAISPGCLISSLSILLRKDDSGFGLCPDDLFFGSKEITENQTKSTNKTQIIYISRKNARMHVTVKGLPANLNEDDYYFVICKKNNGYCFKGHPIEGYIEMKQAGVLQENKEYFTTLNAFNIIHTSATKEEDCITINLLKKINDKKSIPIVSVHQDKDGCLIAPKAGETTNVLIDLTSGLTNTEVLVEITSWNQIYHWYSW